MRRQIRIEGDVAYVPLTHGYEAIIDAADVPLVDGVSWFARIKPRTVYALSNTPRPKRRMVRLHRIIMGEPDGLEIDHIDGDGLNNRRSNLRVATSSQNKHNMRAHTDSRSGFKGVTWTRGKWLAQIGLNGKNRGIGYFDTPEAAHAAYCAASAKLHGEFGRSS